MKQASPMHVKRSLAGAIRTSSGLVSRGSTGLIFVLMSRKLPESEFGTSALVVGVVLATAAFLTTSLGDSLVYALTGKGSQSLFWFVALSAGLAGSAPVLLGASPYVAFGAAAIGHALVFSGDRSFRGPGPALDVYLIATPLVRLFAAWGASDGERAVLTVLTISTSALAVFQGILALRSAGHSHFSGVRVRVGRATLVMMSSASVFLVISQMDVLALGLLIGPSQVALYVPTMKTMEALTAVGVYWSVQAPHRFLNTDRGVREAASLSLRASTTYVVVGVPLILSGQWLVPAMFGGSTVFLLPVALILFVGYASLTALSPLLQWFAFKGDATRGVAVTISMLIGVPVVLWGTSLESQAIVAAGVSLAYLAGFITGIQLARLPALPEKTEQAID